MFFFYNAVVNISITVFLVILMNIFDEFIIGNTDVIEWGFDNSHFNQRLLDNGISRKFIEDTVKNQEPLRWENESGSKYAVFFNAPSTKDYKEIKVIFGCEGNKINLVSVIPISKKFKSKKYGDFDNGIPVDDTIARVVSNIDSLAFEKMFIEWMQECHEITDGEIIAIDGKTIRGSFDKGKRKGAIHMVSAFSNENGVVLGQVKTEAKSNEITAIPELLNLLYLKKNLITIDAMGCQKDIASKIKDKKADYLLAVKGNQGKLHHAFEEKFPVNVFSNYKGDSFSTQEISHGRKETRLHIVSNVTPELL